MLFGVFLFLNVFFHQREDGWGNVPSNLGIEPPFHRQGIENGSWANKISRGSNINIVFD